MKKYKIYFLSEFEIPMGGGMFRIATTLHEVFSGVYDDTEEKAEKRLSAHLSTLGITEYHSQKFTILPIYSN